LDRLLVCSLACLFATIPVSACQDSADHPMAMTVAPETHGALAFSQQLPSVPELLAREGLAPAEVPEARAWERSWTMDEAQGAELRDRLYPSVARLLFLHLGAEGVDELMAKNQEALQATEASGVSMASEVVGTALERARRRHEEAVWALEEDRGEEALVHVLRTGDALRAVAPRQVAATLVARASEAFRRNQGDGSYSEEELARLRRLTAGARKALEDGDYPRAIRRAYYACQILGADPQ